MNRSTSRNNRQYHGLGNTPTYRTWYSMQERCGNPENASWRHYGAKGITVCERWKSIQNFVADMGLRPPGMTLDRIDLTRGYEPGNCRWATELEQQRNRSSVKCTVAVAARIRELRSAGAKDKDLAQMFGMCQSNVNRIANGRTWKADAQS